MFIKRINFTLKNPDFFNINIRNKWKCLLLFHDWFPVKFEFIHIQYFFGKVRKKTSHRRCSVGGVLRNFTKFLGRHLCQSLFFNKVAGLRKKKTDKGVFLWILRNFQEQLFYRTPLDDCFLRNKLYTKYLLELIKRRSKVQETIMSCERALNFDQWKTFSGNYKPMRAWSWLVYKFAENYYPSRLFSEFIQTQKRHPTSPDKIRILIRKLLVISS